MTTEEIAKAKGKRAEARLGIFLLIPPIIGIIAFIISILKVFDQPELDNPLGRFIELEWLSTQWSGDYGYSSAAGGGGFTSAIPIYLGLMAIAGVLLLKDSLQYLYINSSDL